jgi:uncharacterized protein YqeY
LSILEKIKDALIAARKNKSKFHIDTYSYILGQFNQVAANISDEEAMKILKRIRKQSTEVGDVMTVAICNRLLPSQMSEGEIRLAIDTIVQVEGIKTFPASFGVIMGHFNKQYPGRADMKLVSKILKSYLNG